MGAYECCYVPSVFLRTRSTAPLQPPQSIYRKSETIELRLRGVMGPMTDLDVELVGVLCGRCQGLI